MADSDNTARTSRRKARMLGSAAFYAPFATNATVGVAAQLRNAAQAYFVEAQA